MAHAGGFSFLARIPSPWFWEERAECCVTIRGRRHRLGPHPDGLPIPKKVKGRWNAPQPVLQKFHDLMSRPESLPRPAGEFAPGVAEILDRHSLAEVVGTTVRKLRRDKVPLPFAKKVESSGLSVERTRQRSQRRASQRRSEGRAKSKPKTTQIA